MNENQKHIDSSEQSAAKTHPSLLDQHLQIMGMSSNSVSDEAELAAERSRIDGLVLMPLVLPKRRFHQRKYTQVLALAASIALLVVGGQYYLKTSGDPRSEGSGGSMPGFRAKGESKVWLYWERNGQVLSWNEGHDGNGGMSLVNGDRLRVEVLASEEVTAYQAVINSKEQLLSDPAQVLQNPLRLKAAQKASFEGSIKLVGANEGETLLVFICKDSGSGLLQDDSAAKIRSLLVSQGRAVNLAAVPAGCVVEKFKLR